MRLIILITAMSLYGCTINERNDEWVSSDCNLTNEDWITLERKSQKYNPNSYEECIVQVEKIGIAHHSYIGKCLTAISIPNRECRERKNKYMLFDRQSLEGLELLPWPTPDYPLSPPNYEYEDPSPFNK